MKNSLFFFIFFLTNSLNIFGQTHSLTPPPFCPQGGNEFKLLPSTYPLRGIIISLRDDHMITQYDETLLKTLLSIRNEPENQENFKIYFSGKQSSYKRLLKKTNTLEKEVAHITNIDYTWQQDFQFAFTDEIGVPMIQFSSAYPNVGKLLTFLPRWKIPYSNYKKNGFAIGNGLLNLGQHSDLGVRSYNSRSGGNVMGFPGGLCLLGSYFENFPDLVKTLCGSTDNALYADSSWLDVGHIDEILMILPKFKTNDYFPVDACDFDILFASPKLALELLEKNPSESFFSEDAFDYKDQGNLKQIYSDIISHLTQIPVPYLPFYSVLKNKEVMLILESSGLLQHNDEIQRKISIAKKSLQEQIYKKLPQCVKKIKFIDVPNFFYPAEEEDDDDDDDVNYYSAINPNPTNSVVTSSSIIMPKQFVNTFQKYLEKLIPEYSNLTPVFIKTTPYPHFLEGNIHCSTKEIRSCINP